MKSKPPLFTWHPHGAKERPGLVLLMVGVACFVVGVMIGHHNIQRDTIPDLNATAPIADSPAPDSMIPHDAVQPSAVIETTDAQSPPPPLPIAKPKPERFAASPPAPAINARPIPAPTPRRAKVVENRLESTVGTPPPALPTPSARPTHRRVQSSSADYSSLRRTILQQ